MKAATALQKAYCLRGVVQEHAMKYTDDSTFPFHRPKLSRKICFTHSLNYGGLCEEHSTKQATDNFQRRALLKKIMETPKNQCSVSLSQIYLTKEFYTFLLLQARN